MGVCLVLGTSSTTAASQMGDEGSAAKKEQDYSQFAGLLASVMLVSHCSVSAGLTFLFLRA